MNKIHTGILAAALLAAASVAQATSKPDNSGTVNQGGTGNGYGGQGGSAVAGASAGAVGVGVGLGGAGGSGGAGGAGGNGGLGGAGGSVAGSGNSANSNVNTAKGGNAQQGQAQSSRNDNKSSAAGNTTAVNVGGDYYDAARIPVATAAAWAAPATAPCYATWGGGVQTAVVGASVTGGTKDQDCSTMEVARRADLMGEKEIAREVMCDLAQYRAARARRGDPCTADKAEAQTAAVVAPEERDPIKRYRAGLPPLK